MSEIILERTVAIFASEQNKKLVARLRAEGGVKLIEFPAVIAEAVESNAPNEEIFVNLTDFDWLIFPDVFAVEFFLERLAERGFDLFALDELRVCALGEAVADRLRFVQLHADIIPHRTDAVNVFSALADYLSLEAAEFINLRFLLPAEISYSSPLGEMLGARGASVRHFPVYRLGVENQASGGLSRLEALLAGGAIDEFIFATAAEAFDLENLFRRDLKTLLADASVSVSGDEVAFQTLRERGLRPLYLTKK